MTSLLHLADRVFNTPLLIHPDKAEVILFALRERLNVDVSAPAPDASRFLGSRKTPDGRMTLTRRENGVALITIAGSLVNRGAWLDANSGLVSYEGIAAQIREAAADPTVATIVLDIDSPGGEAGGMVGLAEAIRSARQSKRVVAVVDDMAASAAYGIASAADEIVASETSTIGSIGVVLLHLDRSAELAEKGVKPTLIHAGAHKVDGNPFGPLPDAVRADLQASVNQIYETFIETVAKGRGIQNGRRGRTLRTLTADKARATEARVFLGTQAVEAGLADRIGTLESVVADYSINSRATSRAKRQENVSMNHPTDMISAEAHRAAVDAAVSKAKADAALENKLATEAATAEIAAKARAEESARIFGIVDAEVSKGKLEAALNIARTGATVEQAVAVLAVVTVAPNTSLAARMANDPAATGQDPEPPKSDASKDIWARQVERINARNARAR